MKAAPAQQRALLDLAELDADLARTRHDLANLPQYAELTRIDTDLQAAHDDVSAAEKAIADLQTEYDRSDAELTGMTTHLERDQRAIDSGALDHKVIAEMQHEVAGLTRRREVLESDLLEIMERQEATDAELQRARQRVESLTAQRTDTEVQRENTATELSGKVEDLEERRGAVAGDLPGDLVTVYDRIRAQGKVGAGLVRQRRCGACRLELDPSTLSRIAAAPEDEVLRCEECDAIMVRTDQSGLPKAAGGE